MSSKFAAGKAPAYAVCLLALAASAVAAQHAAGFGSHVGITLGKGFTS